MTGKDVELTSFLSAFCFFVSAWTSSFFAFSKVVLSSAVGDAAVGVAGLAVFAAI